MTRRVQWTTTAIASLAALVLVVAASAGTARGPKLSLAWKAPTPPDGATLTVTVGQPLTLELAAASNQPQLVHHRQAQAAGRRGLSAGYGSPAVGTVTWTPTAEQVGEHVMTFGAQNARPAVRVRASAQLPRLRAALDAGGPNEPFSLSGPNGLSRWAHIDRPVAARTRPSSSAKVITRLRPLTPELTANLTLTLAGQINEKGEYWVRVRLPVLPNGSTGWVPRNALGPFRKNWTRLVIDRALFTATLYRRGVAVFKTRVGVGKSYWPTPAGEFSRTQPAHGLLGSDLRADRVRDECTLGSAHGLARRRLHRHPRHKPAADPARPGLTRLRTDAERRDQASFPPDAARYARHDQLRKPSAGFRGRR